MRRGTDSLEPLTPRRVIRVLLVDDHSLFRKGVRDILSEANDMQVIGEAGNVREGVEKVVALRPDVVLMDINMPGQSGVDGVREILHHWPGAHVVMLTIYGDETNVFEAIKSGAMGYLTKDLSADALTRAVRGVLNGELPMSRQMASRIMTQLIKQPYQTANGGLKATDLTSREREILELMSRGYKDKEIAAALCIANSTVHKHVQNILSKLHARNRVEAIDLTRAQQQQQQQASNM